MFLFLGLVSVVLTVRDDDRRFVAFGLGAGGVDSLGSVRSGSGLFALAGLKKRKTAVRINGGNLIVSA